MGGEGSHPLPCSYLRGKVCRVTLSLLARLLTRREGSTQSYNKRICKVYLVAI